MGSGYNDAKSGAKMVDLPGQVATAVGQRPDYITILMGANDVCTSSEATMTDVATCRSQLDSALNTISANLPNARIFVASIPDVYQLWALFKDDFFARFIWSVGGVCQSMLVNPTSTQAVDVQRREQVRQRNIDFNTQLAQVCATYATCLWDGNAVFNTTFTKSDVAGDYFHPSVAGQAKLAAGTWAVGYTFAAAPPPPPTPMWVSGLSATTTGGRTWSATATVAVRDASGPVAGVVVAGTWSTGGGATSCTTTPAGTCSLTLAGLTKKSQSVTFSVTGLTKSGWTYTPGSNSATSITILKP
jgi:lysophospholipase L1-like esterase